MSYLRAKITRQVCKTALPYSLRGRIIQKIMWRVNSDRAYSRGINSLAHAYVLIGREHPHMLVPSFVDNYSADDLIWKEFTQRHPKADAALGGMSGASASCAYNLARMVVLGLQPSEHPTPGGEGQ